MKAEGPYPAAVTYHRVSTVDQDPTLARAELRRAVALRELALVDEIEETGSGARNDRPGLQRVLELAAAGHISHLLVWKLDRFGRSALDALSNIERLNRAGVTFVCTSQGIEAGPRAGAMGRLVMMVLAAIAEFERENGRERTRLGVAAARARGKRLGRPPAWIDPVRLSAMTGWPLARIAREFGVNRDVIRRYLSKMGAPPADRVPPDFVRGAPRAIGRS